ncbi:hypothetical protein THO17_32710 [Marinomonas sp. THO17]
MTKQGWRTNLDDIKLSSNQQIAIEEELNTRTMIRFMSINFMITNAIHLGIGRTDFMRHTVGRDRRHHS